jgi:hypothetical protein
MNLLPNVLIKAYENGYFTKDNGEKIETTSQVSEQEASGIYEVVKHLQPENSCEVGFYQGFSALSILQALEDNGKGTHYACDPSESTLAKNIGLENAKNASLAHRLQFHECCLEDLYPHLPNLQFAFIDASHLFDLTLCEFLLIDKKMDIGGVVGFHDLWMPSLRKLLDFILSNRSYEFFTPSGSNEKFHEGSNKGLKKLLIILFMSRPKLKKLLNTQIIFDQKYSIPNMVFLKKTADDNRKWTHYNDF